MDIRDFYTQLLDLGSPWTVEAVIAKEKSETVDVYLECAQTSQFPCPQCNRSCPVTDYSPPREWRHLNTCRKKTYLRARLPVVDCPEHGRQHPRFPWADAGSPLSLAFEKWIGRLAEDFRDTKKAALFADVEHGFIRNLLRHTAEEARKVRGTTAAGHEKFPPASSQPEQTSLFTQNMSFVNQGIHAFNNLELEKAVELFQKHRSHYPKGYDVSSRLKAAGFLLLGMREAPAEPGKRPDYMCRFWNSFEDYTKTDGAECDAAKTKSAYFARVLKEVELAGLAGSTILPEDIPLGYILLQAGRYEEATRSLQECIPKMPENAALFGWLGDAYLLREERVVARRCYLEACLIDPAAIDWRHIEDADLKQLKQDILLYYGFDPQLALEWLPSHARIEGLFERKVVRLHDGMKETVEDYLTMEKVFSKESSPRMAAKLFFRGMVLYENREHLKFIKKIDLIEVRRMMKQANQDLFEEFLEKIVEKI